MGPMPETSSTISASSSPALNSASFGRFVKRGIPPTSSAGEIVEQVSPRLSPMSVIHGLPPTPSEPSTSLSPVTHAKHIPHIPFSRDQRRPEEVTPLLTEPLRSSAFPFGSARKRPNFPLPNIDTSHANLNQKFSNDEKRLATFDIESKSPIQEEQQSELKPKIQNTTKKMKTEDITFALTILNTIGNIPSLILTMINAYYYRGNPKVD
nr:hypothetical protein BN887_05817 [Melanopsichium pennsylvanicum 4]